MPLAFRKVSLKWVIVPQGHVKIVRFNGVNERYPSRPMRPKHHLKRARHASGVDGS